MPPHNTPERPSTPTLPYAPPQATHPNTPASYWSSTPSTPQSEGTALRNQQHQADQADQQGVTLVPTRRLVRRMLVDLRNLDYVSAVDENLICPICRVALINPVTTTCDHVFCKECFDQSHVISATCPIDRCPIRLPNDIGPTHKLILNQLDGLDVKCPHTDEGCQRILARSMVQNHVEKYCGYTMVDCPAKTCTGKIRRKDISNDCLHYASQCPDCTENVIAVDIERHRQRECSERNTACGKCGVEFLRCGLDEHESECGEAVVPCQWAIYGCLYSSKRSRLVDHAPKCDFKVMGPVVESLKGEIDSLRAEVQFLNERDKTKDRRIKFLESERSIASGSANALDYPPAALSGMAEDTHPSMDYAPYDSRDQYLLSLVESQEAKVDQLSLGMTELEAKQTMMLFNETIPIKEQLAELRSAQGVIGMHVRWLMNFRLQERRPGSGAGPSEEPKSGGGPGGPDFQSMRRSSDTMRELVTKL